MFGIDASSGQLQTKGPLDYETNNTYTVSVGVRDSKDPEGETDTRRDDSIRVTIIIVNQDDPGHVTLSAPTPRTGTPLRAALANPDGGIADLVWAWEKSSDRTTWSPIEDATAAAYTPTEADKNHYLRVVVSYTEGHGPAKTATAAADEAATVGYTTSFADTPPEGAHTPAIAALAADGVFVDTECGPNLFCPNQPIQRWVMAVWLIRALDQDPPHHRHIPLRRHSRRTVVDPLRRTTRRPQNHGRMRHQPTTVLPEPVCHPSTNGQLPGPSVPTTPSPNTSRVRRHRKQHPHRQHRRASRRRHNRRLCHRPAPLLPQPGRNPSTNGHLPQPSPHQPSTARHAGLTLVLPDRYCRYGPDM